METMDPSIQTPYWHTAMCTPTLATLTVQTQVQLYEQLSIKQILYGRLGDIQCKENAKSQMFFLTGVFTAPLHGVYHFSFCHHHSAGNGGYTFLHKNTQRLASTHSYNTDGQFTTANGVTVQLDQGDEVYVNLQSGSWVYDSVNNYSIFNGILLFTL